MVVWNPWAIWYMLMEEEEEMEKRFNSYTYTNDRYIGTTPTGGTRPMTSEAGAQRYHRKKLRKVL